ncbi:uncharacterized protein KY384_006044 [Bacidia gigantensis]|uniref:uncharacterized protein n=1 Tax=Bacidia gigantensis TaxID=2732470 RepID=UPI001D03C30D|nr:uncharacterized protein KY384_006044 [Bacidia gigantensis]KAG8529407.1 hypothetical protein KY384_006044 [Bacidia gigantensis]
MPQAKIKPSDIAAEAKRHFIPLITQKYPQFPARSTLYPDSANLKNVGQHKKDNKLRIAVLDGDPVDVALEWHDSNFSEGSASRSSLAGASIPVVNMANEKRAGGDWESGLIAPEECLCRRSTLAQALVAPCSLSSKQAHYPIRTTGGIYSPSVVIFRSSSGKGYAAFKEFKALPVISVAPVRRPKLDESGINYSFKQEKDMMMEKMRTILRIAMIRGHSDLVMGAFGVGYGFRNPAVQVAKMWKEILLHEKEFSKWFSNVVFAIESTSGTNKDGTTDLEIFKQEFAPSNINGTSYR